LKEPYIHSKEANTESKEDIQTRRTGWTFDGSNHDDDSKQSPTQIPTKPIYTQKRPIHNQKRPTNILMKAENTAKRLVPLTPAAA